MTKPKAGYGEMHNEGRECQAREIQMQLILCGTRSNQGVDDDQNEDTGDYTQNRIVPGEVERLPRAARVVNAERQPAGMRRAIAGYDLFVRMAEGVGNVRSEYVRDAPLNRGLSTVVAPGHSV